MKGGTESSKVSHSFLVVIKVSGILACQVIRFLKPFFLSKNLYYTERKPMECTLGYRYLSGEESKQQYQMYFHFLGLTFVFRSVLLGCFILID